MRTCTRSQRQAPGAQPAPDPSGIRDSPSALEPLRPSKPPPTSTPHSRPPPRPVEVGFKPSLQGLVVEASRHWRCGSASRWAQAILSQPVLAPQEPSGVMGTESPGAGLPRALCCMRTGIRCSGHSGPWHRAAGPRTAHLSRPKVTLSLSPNSWGAFLFPQEITERSEKPAPRQ